MKYTKENVERAAALLERGLNLAHISSHAFVDGFFNRVTDSLSDAVNDLYAKAEGTERTTGGTEERDLLVGDLVTYTGEVFGTHVGLAWQNESGKLSIEEIRESWDALPVEAQSMAAKEATSKARNG